MKPRGLYELLLTKALAELLTQLPDNLEPLSEPLRSAEAPDRISLHLGRAVQKFLEDVPEAERVKAGVELVDRLLPQIGANPTELLAETLTGTLLRAIGFPMEVARSSPSRSFLFSTPPCSRTRRENPGLAARSWPKCAPPTASTS